MTVAQAPATAAELPALPGARDEAWRYTPVDDIVAVLRSSRPAPRVDVARDIVDRLAGDHGSARLALVNGVVAPELSDTGALPPGVWCGPTPGADTIRPLDDLDGFEALGLRAGAEIASVIVPAGVQVTVPLHVVHVAVPGASVGGEAGETGPAATVAHPRVVVDVGDGARLEVVETWCGLDGPALTNASTTLRVGRDATVDLVRVQAEGSEAVHVGRTVVEQAARSQVRATSVMVGAAIARSALDVRLRGPEARVELDGLYLPRGRQRHDNPVSVDHAASHCTSVQRFKGVIAGHARGSFSGRVVVRPGTVGTDARQANPNLLLDRTAEADTRPWLEILADDVACTHAATVGRLDDDALFYLRSRGIPREVGHAMLVDAFVHEITDAIPHPSVRLQVGALLEAAR